MVNCAAEGCRNRTGIRNGITFHSFPADPVRRALWIKAVGRDNWQPSIYSKLCSLHFQEEDLDRTSLACVRVREHGVPKIFPVVTRRRRKPAKKTKNLRVLHKVNIKSVSEPSTNSELDKPACLASYEIRKWTCTERPENEYLCILEESRDDVDGLSDVIGRNPIEPTVWREEVEVKPLTEEPQDVEENVLQEEIDIKEELQEETDENEPQEEIDIKEELLTAFGDELQEGTETEVRPLTAEPQDVEENVLQEELEVNPSELREEMDENEPQEEIDIKEELLTVFGDELQEGTEDLREHFSTQCVVKQGDKEEEELTPPVRVFLVCNEPKEAIEESGEDPLLFSEASENNEEIPSLSGRECNPEETYDSQTSARSAVGQCSRNETFNCPICQKSLSKKHLSAHMRIHTGEKNNFCPICRKSFREKCNLDVHMRIHIGKKKYLCSVCQKGFVHGGNLFRHMQNHFGDRPHQCSKCQKCFKDRSRLINHMQVHNDSNSTHICPVCQKTFTRRQSLVMHMQIHTWEKSYPCSYCPKSFRYNSNLISHMQSHTGGKPHICTLCQKSFPCTQSLDLHMRMHMRMWKVYHALCGRKVL